MYMLTPCVEYYSNPIFWGNKEKQVRIKGNTVVAKSAMIQKQPLQYTPLYTDPLILSVQD